LIWSPNFYALPGFASISSLCDSSDGYVLSRGRALYPMDISSALAVYALGIETCNDSGSRKVIDLCCSPGNKFQMISEQLNCDSLIVGVDISDARLNTCKSLLRRHSRHANSNRSVGPSNRSVGPRQLIFHGDGTIFSRDSMGSLVYDSQVHHYEYSHLADRMKLNKSNRSKLRRSLEAVQSRLEQGEEPLGSSGKNGGCISLGDFDYAIVDAECTHDASYRHLSHINAPSSNGDLKDNEVDNEPSFNSETLNTAVSSNNSNRKNHRSMNESNNLRALQRDLLSSGFRLLRPGGVLVYSTCSRDVLQNEEIVKWLLLSEGNSVELVPVVDDVQQYINKAHASINKVHAENTEVGASNGAPSQVGIEILQQELPELIASLKTLDSSAIRDLSHRLCCDVASQSRPLLLESTVLPGTMNISYKSGMSGLFVAKIRKTI